MYRTLRQERRRDVVEASFTKDPRVDAYIGALLSAKDHVTVFLYDGGLAPDPEGIITGGHGNVSGRMQVRRDI
jgi:hypothetical protein